METKRILAAGKFVLSTFRERLICGVREELYD